MREVGRNLQAHKPIRTVQPIIDGTKKIGNALNILYREGQ